MLFNGSFSVNASGTEGDISTTPDMTAKQWYLMDNASNNGVAFPGWNSYQNHVPAANVDPNKKIVVAVLDSGVDYTHEDLAGVMWNEGLNYQALTALGGGQYGIDTMDGDGDPMDQTGHGTHVAGIIAAEWNEKGISGALCGVKIMAVRGTPGTTESVKQGLEYILAAKKAGVNIAAVNLSWNGSTAYSFPEILDKVITELGEAGVVTVFAAGNESADLNEDRVVSNYLRTNPYVITVSASGVDGKRWEEGIKGGSNYSSRWCDIVAPGQKILSTYLRDAELTQAGTAELTMEDDSEEEDDPTVPDGYKYLSGTSMAAPIVTAALTLLYAEHPDWDAGQRAAALLEASDSSVWQSVYSGKVNPTAALNKANREPLVTYGESVGSKSVLTLYGYDFGGSSGTVKVDGSKVSVLSWSDRQIKVKGSFALGEHSVQVIRADQKTSTRWVAVSGSSEEVIALNTGGMEGLYFPSAAVLNGTLYALAMDSDNSSDCELYALENGTWTKKQLIDKPEYFNSTTSCGHQDKLYFFFNGAVYEYDPSSGQMTKIDTGTSLNLASSLSLWSVNGKLYALYKESVFGSPERIKVDEIDPASGVCTNVTAFQQEDVKTIGLVYFKDSLTVLTEDNLGSVITAFTVSDGTAKKLFSYSEPDEKAFGVQKRVYANNDHLIITPFAEQDGNGSWSFNAYELTASGTKLRSFRLGAGRVSILYPLSGGVYEKDLYLIGTADAIPGNTFAFRIPLTEYVPPTPTPTPTPVPVPTPVPTSAPDSHSDSSSSVTPGSTVQTCQDVGYPAGWYWDESRKACVAPPKSSTGVSGNSGTNNGTYNYRKNSTGTNPNTNTNPGTGGDDQPGSSTDPDAEATESAEPEDTPTPTPEETIEPTPSATPDLPMPIVNTKGIMWFLGIPLVMVLAGIVMYLLKDKQFVPWVIGADAIIGLILAILDHSMVGWILLILNLAASGLMALYRLGKLDGE